MHKLDSFLRRPIPYHSFLSKLEFSDSFSTFYTPGAIQATWYLDRQKEVKKRYSLKNLQKSLSKQIDVNAVIESFVQLNLFFSV